MASKHHKPEEIVAKLRHVVVLGVDWPALARRARAAAERLRSANATSRALAERLEPHVAQFCMGLRSEPSPLPARSGAG